MRLISRLLDESTRKLLIRFAIQYSFYAAETKFKRIIFILRHVP